MTENIAQPLQQVELVRIRLRDAKTNPVEGFVRWDPLKSISYLIPFLVALLFAIPMISVSAVAVCGFITSLTLCCGHSVGLHRMLIHRSFRSPLWLERTLVYLGVMVGMGGPLGMLYMHDMRDWAQRHSRCHRFFAHRNSMWKDYWWNLHCEIELDHPPEFRPDPSTVSDRFYQFLERTWRWQQLPLALMLYAIGGWSWVVWGICVRVPMCLTGHWLIGYLAHNGGARDWHVNGHAVQGYNILGLGLISMGEAWHNNHHAYPGSARHGHTFLQFDPGWWLIACLRQVGLAKDVVLPDDLPQRAELSRLGSSTTDPPEEWPRDMPF